MSLRNRARSLQKKTGLTYQQALARLRALGDRPATLRRRTHWPLEVCDRYLVDGRAPILVQEGPTVDDAPIEVGESDSVYDRIRAVCEALRRSIRAARAVDLVDLRGHVLVRVGDAGDDSKTVELHIRRDPSVSYVTAATRAKLRVWFHVKEKTDLFVESGGRTPQGGPGRSSACSPTAESPMMPPASSGGGTGGIPGASWPVVEPDTRRATEAEAHADRAPSQTRALSGGRPGVSYLLFSTGRPASSQPIIPAGMTNTFL